jgi:glutamate synthase (NADPH/NADH) small chain
MGYRVTVFEAFHSAGGVLCTASPSSRLPKAIVQYEVDALAKLGVELY